MDLQTSALPAPNPGLGGGSQETDGGPKTIVMNGDEITPISAGS